MSKEANNFLNEVANWQYEQLIENWWMADFYWHQARRMAVDLIGKGC